MNKDTYQDILKSLKNGRAQTLAMLQRRGMVLPDLPTTTELADDAARQLWESFSDYQSVDDIEKFLNS